MICFHTESLIKDMMEPFLLRNLDSYFSMQHIIDPFFEMDKSVSLYKDNKGQIHELQKDDPQ